LATICFNRRPCAVGTAGAFGVLPPGKLENIFALTCGPMVAQSAGGQRVAGMPASTMAAVW
jgi:hypothetical protein